MKNVLKKICPEIHNTYIMFKQFFFPKIVLIMRRCGKTRQSQRGERWL